MAQEEVKGDFKPEPTVQLANKEGTPGAFLKGVLAGPGKAVPNMGKFKKTKYLYQIRLKDTNASVQLKQSNGKYVETSVEENDLLVLWATEPLHRKLMKITPGTSIEIQYHGKSQNPETGNTSHVFKVFKDVEA